MKKSTDKIGFIYIIPFIIMGIILFTGCGPEEKEKAKENIIPVKTATVTREDISIPLHTSGRLYPKTMVKLSFKVGGLIEKLYVDEGDTVKKGQLLATLDLSEIDARCKQAQNAFDKAQRDLKRVKNLYKDRAATLEQKQNAETAYEVAESNLKIARFNLKHARITAPARGKILKRLVEANEMTGAGSPAFLFGSIENNWVIKAGVSARDMVRLQLEDNSTVEFDAYPGKTFSGKVTEISDSIDAASGTYEVEISVEDNGMKLAAGFVGKVAIEPAASEKVFIIPVDAVVEGEGNDGVVFTVKNNKAARIKITVAHIFPTRIAVRNGLENIDSVITVGAAYLNDGSSVKVVD